MDLYESSFDLGDDRFQTPRTFQSHGKSASYRSSVTPRSSHSDDWRTASSRSSIYAASSAISDTASYRTPRKADILDRDDGYFSVASRQDMPPPRSGSVRHGSIRSQTLSEISETEPLDERDILDLFSYARHGRCEDISIALARGMPVDIRDETGNTMLIVACQNGNKRVVKLLLRNGASINVRNYRGNTPLHYCYHFGYGDTLGEYLISKGADTSIRNNVGHCCWDGL